MGEKRLSWAAATRGRRGGVRTSLANSATLLSQCPSLPSRFAASRPRIGHHAIFFPSYHHKKGFGTSAVTYHKRLDADCATARYPTQVCVCVSACVRSNISSAS